MRARSPSPVSDDGVDRFQATAGTENVSHQPFDEAPQVLPGMPASRPEPPLFSQSSVTGYTAAPAHEQDITSVRSDEDIDQPRRLTETPSPQPSSTVLQDGLTPRQAPHSEDFATPAVNRRDFLLSLVDTSARPRLALPTPHPKPIQRPFLTPRPTHPLSQVYTASTPTEEADERSSFISTASSHDLTVHARVNASFDPASARGANVLSRFDVAKLNTYLHGLNRRLTEENKLLTERLVAEGHAISRDLHSIAESEADHLSKGVMETLVNELEECRRERERVERELTEEQEKRTQDKDRFKQRLAQV